ncbi:hypothetical protein METBISCDRAFT_19292 [Metschnikowia bicuspidata]|uniref:RING-type domain-containing protein n=1 Tax=Metschnikowia bicuspidata TaxID=27322 RepID=A0A4P9Z9B5_9ASCO|nr:hypothetical protein METBISCDRAFT_19292 [Metschnikowia bicuspidata]
MTSSNTIKSDGTGGNARNEGGQSRAAKKNAASIKHLLEFLLYRDLPEYRQQLDHSFDNYSGPQNSGRLRMPQKRTKHHLHGMRFINVNYKFVVDCRKPYLAQQLDPNVPVDQEDILCIVTPQGTACPICLSEELMAPRMITSCGHVLCLPCLLALLDSKLPASMKRESKAVVEKYTDCPLCASVIRRGEIKPVVVDTTDVRFDMPKVNDEVVLTLMARQSSQIVPVPSAAFSETGDAGCGQFPWADQLQTAPFLRIYRGSLDYVIAMYDQEKAALKDAYENDRDTFFVSGKLLALAYQSIDEDLKSWTEKFLSEYQPEHVTGNPAAADAWKTAFYYYQTGFKCATTFILSALDMKVLKASYGSDYLQLPPSVVAKVENICYDEMDEELATSRYKYILHLPLGTQLGFLECCWQNNEYILPDAWATYKSELLKRSKKSARKLHQEEKSQQRAFHEEERRAREYIEEVNHGAISVPHDPVQWANSGGIGPLSITYHRELPALLRDSPTRSRSLSADASESTQRSVWGTKIPKTEAEEQDDGWDADEMIRKAREEIEKQEGKKQKKKYILILTNGWP